MFFCRLPLASTRCIIGTEKYPHGGILSKYDDADYSQSYGLIKETFRALEEDDFLQAYIS